MQAGLQWLVGGSRLERHAHRGGHLTVVVAGGYLEAGNEGRWMAKPGDVIVHRPYSCHANFVERTSRVLNLVLDSSFAEGQADPPEWSFARLADPDALVKLAERDKGQAVTQLLALALPESPFGTEPVDRLAMSLRRDPAQSIGVWAHDRALGRERLSREFRASYGVSIKRFRADCRAQLAFAAICGSREPLAELAARLGYSDQAHLTRSIVDLCGQSPQNLRRLSRDGGRSATSTVRPAQSPARPASPVRRSRPRP